MPRTKKERKGSRPHLKHVCLDRDPDDVPRSPSRPRGPAPGLAGSPRARTENSGDRRGVGVKIRSAAGQVRGQQPRVLRRTWQQVHLGRSGRRGPGWVGTQLGSESRKPAPPRSRAPGACGADVLRFCFARLSGFLGRWGAQPLGGRPAFVSRSEAQAGAAGRGRRAGERGTGDRARPIYKFPQLPAPRLTPGGPGGAGRLGAPRTRGSRLAAAAAAGVRPGPGGGRAPACPGASPALSAPRAPLVGLGRLCRGSEGRPGSASGLCSAGSARRRCGKQQTISTAKHLRLRNFQLC
ncbi:PREDICTED: cuticle collagen 2C-like [Bison bison bison]|uniref:Cuticle collagen 2C-like n=1 Tax=Bison bison bison TaxID=43346 RepID=A0A6P3IQW6_BISBB|nr:PREDICTED: cuticle collagen 2C-like [Bison bison bison]